MLRKLTAAALLALLLACSAGGNTSDTPAPPASPCGTAQGAGSFCFVVRSTSKLIVVHVDAVDQFMGKGVAGESGKPYPFDATRPSPYTHTVFFQPGLVVSATLRAWQVEPEGEDVLTCETYDAMGKLVDKSVVPGNQSVVCMYTGGMPGVPKLTVKPGS